MKGLLYKIENLTCGYNDSEIVLRVPDLKILAGRIYVVLGKSGSGKSTFLETLGLMNNTLRSGKILFAPPTLNGHMPSDIGAMWKDTEKGKMDNVRCRHFSFIFQQTNLMPNFTVYENIYITSMMQGASREDCHKATSDILDRLGMSFVDGQRKVTELSGGQRQRVAFARATIASYDVLFGDEPTGNLDIVNSIELLEVLKESVKSVKGATPRTAIIVSHNIDLALRFADTILVINKIKENAPGEILQDNCFERTMKKENEIKWFSPEQAFSCKEMKSHLQTLFNSRR